MAPTPGDGEHARRRLLVDDDDVRPDLHHQHQVLDDGELGDGAAVEIEVGLELLRGARHVLFAEVEARAQVDAGVEPRHREPQDRRAHLGVALALVEPLPVDER